MLIVGEVLELDPNGPFLLKYAFVYAFNGGGYIFYLFTLRNSDIGINGSQEALTKIQKIKF